MIAQTATVVLPSAPTLLFSILRHHPLLYFHLALSISRQSWKSRLPGLVSSSAAMFSLRSAKLHFLRVGGPPDFHVNFALLWWRIGTSDVLQCSPGAHTRLEYRKLGAVVPLSHIIKSLSFLLHKRKLNVLWPPLESWIEQVIITHSCREEITTSSTF